MQAEYLTAEQVAERFQVTSKTVRDWLRAGDLVGVRLGRNWRIKASDLERFLDRQRLNGLMDRARRRHPDIKWKEGRCASCGEAIPVPAYGASWVCSTACKTQHDKELAELLDPGTFDFVTSQAQVIPPL